MDRILRRELDAIARDHIAGAAELTDRAASSILGWLQRTQEPSPAVLTRLAATILRGHGKLMAPLYRLTNEILWAADNGNPAKELSETCRQFQRTVRHGNAQIARHFSGMLRKRGKPTAILTYSYSSTMVRAVLQARAQIRHVYCAESRPQFEGRKTAVALSSAKLRVTLVPDTVALLLLNPAEPPFESELHVVVGADQVRQKEIINKAGTELFLGRAHQFGRQAWVLADSTKLVPPHSPHLCSVQGGESKQRHLWPGLPAKVSVFDQILGLSKLFPSTKVLTEQGTLTPAQAGRAIRKLRISPRMHNLLD